MRPDTRNKSTLGVGETLDLILLSRVEEFTGVGAAAVGFTQTGQHPRQLGHPVVAGHPPHSAGTLLSGGMHHQMHVGIRRDLRQVRDHDDLVGAGQPGQPAPDLHRGPAADAGIHLIEHHRGAY